MGSLRFFGPIELSSKNLHNIYTKESSSLMCEKYDIDDKTRFLVLYFDARMVVQEISKIINRNEATVRGWIARTKKGEDIRYRIPRKERKKKITAAVEDKVIQVLKDNPEATSTTKLAARFGLSRNSIGKILAKKGYKYKAITLESSIVYSEEERIARVDFCKKMLSQDGKLIYRTFFSDEMGIDLTQTIQKKVWQTSTEKFKRKMLKENVKLNCWGAISAQGATSLDIYEKGMNGDLYRQVITRHKMEMENLFYDGEFYFVQDNHPAHKVSEDWMIKEQKFELIKLPKRSPDLNIIENLWSALKKNIKCEAPTNERELRASLLSNWEMLTRKDKLLLFFEGLYRRYLECIEKGGEKLPY